MPEITDFHEIEVPVPFDISAEDTNVWGEILNRSLIHLEENTILRDDGANRPFPSEEGRLFLDQSDLRLEYDTGDSWQYVGVQAQLLDSGAHTMTTPQEIDFDGDISISETGTNRVKVDIDDSFVRNDGDTITGDLTLGEDLTATSGETIWDGSEKYIPEARLEENAITVTAGNGLSGGGLVTLGGSIAIDLVEGSGSGLDADTLDGIHRENIDWGDVAMAQSDISLADVGAADTNFDANGHDIEDGGTTIWDTSRTHVPLSSLQQDTVTVNSGNALTGGTALTLGEETTLSVIESEISHGNVSDLTGTDHHTQYMHTDARRGFSNPVEGVGPTNQTHLATKEYVDSTAQSLEYKESVLAVQNTPPGSPSTGDRYLIGGSPSGDWSGHPRVLTEYDGSGWVFNPPNEGWSVFVEGENKLRTYNGTHWITFGSTIAHNALQGLADDDHTQYLHRDGRRSMDGTFDTGGNDIEDGGTVIWDTSNNHIPSSSVQKAGLNADTLDGYGSSEFSVREENETITGAWTFDNAVETGHLTVDTHLEIYTESALSETGQDAVWLDNQGSNNQEFRALDGDSNVNGFLFRTSDDGGSTWREELRIEGSDLGLPNGSATINGSLSLGDFFDLAPISEPSAPSSGKRVFVDNNDGGLKVKDTSGTVVTIAE